MTAWAKLLLKSTAAAGSTAWQHLISPFSGSGGTDPVYGVDEGLVVVSATQGLLTAGEPRPVVASETPGVSALPEAGGLTVLV
jgi:hypothetical protein